MVNTFSKVVLGDVVKPAPPGICNESKKNSDGKQSEIFGCHLVLPTLGQFYVIRSNFLIRQ